MSEYEITSIPGLKGRRQTKWSSLWETVKEAASTGKAVKVGPAKEFATVTGALGHRPGDEGLNMRVRSRIHDGILYIWLETK